MTQAVRGLAFMHKNDFLHRDVKPANILVLFPGTLSDTLSLKECRFKLSVAKLADFGLAKQVDPENSEMHSMGVGTGYFRHPSTRNGRYSAATDLFSFGMSMDLIYNSAVLGYFQGLERGKLARWRCVQESCLACPDNPSSLTATGATDLLQTSDVAADVTVAFTELRVGKSSESEVPGDEQEATAPEEEMAQLVWLGSNAHLKEAGGGKLGQVYHYSKDCYNTKGGTQRQVSMEVAELLRHRVCTRCAKHKA